MSTIKKVRIGLVFALAMVAVATIGTHFLGLTPTAQEAQTEPASQRIITVGGNVTEMVYELGLGDALVATDSTSTYPQSAAALPKIGYQRTLSVEGVLGQKPDLLILSGEAGPAPVIEQLKNTGLKVLILPKEHSLDNVKKSIQMIAAATGREAQAQQWIERFEQAEQQASNQTKQPIKALFVMSHTGALTAAGQDTAADAVMRIAGLQNIAHDAFKGYKILNAESLFSQAPDVIITTSEGLDGMGGVDGLLARTEFAHTPAGKNKRVIAMPAMYLIGFGPRQANALVDLQNQIKDIPATTSITQ